MNTIKIFVAFMCLQLVFISNAKHKTTPNKKGSRYCTNPIFTGDYPDSNMLRDRKWISNI